MKDTARKRFTVQQITKMLWEGEALFKQGSTVDEVCRRIGISKQAYYCLRKDSCKMRVDQVRCLKELGKENGR